MHGIGLTARPRQSPQAEQNMIFLSRRAALQGLCIITAMAREDDYLCDSRDGMEPHCKGNKNCFLLNGRLFDRYDVGAAITLRPHLCPAKKAFGECQVPF